MPWLAGHPVQVCTHNIYVAHKAGMPRQKDAHGTHICRRHTHIAAAIGQQMQQVTKVFIASQERSPGRFFHYRSHDDGEEKKSYLTNGSVQVLLTMMAN